MKLDLNDIANTGMEQYKTIVKKKVREATLKHLKDIQQSHSKIKDIKFKELKTQHYLRSPFFSNSEISLLYALRSRTEEKFKANFRNRYANVAPCPFKCWTEGEAVAEDTQQHLLVCSKLRTEFQSEELAKGQVVYEDIFGEVNKQKEAVVLSPN